MIDWLSLAASAIWITGCALALSVLSYAHWQARTRGERLRSILAQPRAQALMHVAGVLFCAGMAAVSPSLVQAVIWLILVILFGAQVRAAWSIIRRQEHLSVGSGSVDRH